MLNIRFTSNPIINDQGTLLGYIAIQQDITEQKEKEEFIQKSLKEKNILLSEIHHRVKNNLAVISAMMQLQMFQETDERVSEKLHESVGRIQTMASLHELLYNTSNFSRIPLDKNIRSIVSNSVHTYDESKTVDINYSLEPVEVNINQAIPCSLIINEVVSNALKYAFPAGARGRLLISLSEEQNMITILIEDNGVGLPSDDPAGDGYHSIGMQIIDVLVRQLDGQHSYESIGTGKRFTLVYKKVDGKGIGSALSEPPSTDA